MLSALEAPSVPSETRLRDLRSAVRRVAELLGNVPAAISLVMEKIQAGLGAVNPIAVGMTLQALYKYPLGLCRGGEGEWGDPDKGQRQSKAKSRVGRFLHPPCRPKGAHLGLSRWPVTPALKESHQKE